MIRRTLYVGSSPLTNVAAGARSTINLAGPRIPMVGSEVLRIHNFTLWVGVELAADSRLLLLDAMNGAINFNNSAGVFQSFIIVVASNPLTAGAPIPFGNGFYIAENGNPIIALVPGFTVSDGSTPPAEIQLAANVDVHNADAAAHRYSIAFSVLIETI
jgi:hypothetical protein